MDPFLALITPVSGGDGGTPPIPGLKPEHPIVIVPPGAIDGVHPEHPIYIPVYPMHPIVIPPGSVDPGPPPKPAHPIVLPPFIPAHPIVIPPDAIAPGVPTHPIVLPDPIRPGDCPHPEHPIYYPPGSTPPEGEKPPVEPPAGAGNPQWDWGWSPNQGWHPVYVPGDKPTPVPPLPGRSK